MGPISGGSPSLAKQESCLSESEAKALWREKTFSKRSSGSAALSYSLPAGEWETLPWPRALATQDDFSPRMKSRLLEQVQRASFFP